jgi:hypothetical protein
MKKLAFANQRTFLTVLGVLFMVLLGVALAQTISLNNTFNASLTPTLDQRIVNSLFREWNEDNVVAVRLDDPINDIDMVINRVNTTQWQLQGEAVEQINQETLNLIVKTVAYIPFTDILTDIPDTNLSNFALTEDLIWLQIQVILDNNDTHVIALGARVPTVDGGYYALVDERSEVFVLNRGAIDYLALNFQQFQSARISSQ